MASTRQEAEVIERKLRPVYDAIDNGQNKKVIQMVEKILKKSPSLHCAKALEAIALIRLGRSEEGRKLVNEVIESRPGDSATLQAIYMYCREIGDYKKMVELYEAAVKSYPNSEEILTQYFMAYVRVNDYQKQQQAALQLVKAFPQSGPYYCWRVMSLLMQAHEAIETNQDDSKQQMCLSLAERLMDKYIDDKRVDAEAEVRLYIAVLQSLGKKEKILSILDGDLKEKLRHPDEILIYELGCLTSLERWDKLAIKLSSIIPNNLDHWAHLKLYITSQISRYIESNATVDSVEEDVAFVCPLEEMKSFLDDLVSKENAKTSRRLRGPYLAQLEAVKQISDNQIKNKSLYSLSELLQQFFKFFSTKSCCYDDMSGYMHLLSDEEQITLLQLFSGWCNEDPTNFNCEDNEVPENTNRLYRDITLCKLQRHCGIHQSLRVDEKRHLVTDCYNKFESGLRFGLTLSSTVNQHSDFYIILAMHLLIEIYQETSNPNELWNSIIMLETARKHSPSNPQIQLLLIKLYSYLGAMDFCTELYNNLSIKHIQIDTLGYITNRYVQAMGTFGFAGQMFQIALRFYINCSKETSDYITSAYKNGIFHKIMEIVKLRDRICRSYEFYELGVESMLQEFMHDVNSMDSAKTYFVKGKYEASLPFTIEDIDVLCDGLCDNRDMAVFDDWSPPNQKTSKEEITLSFQLECLWIKIRLLIMQILKELLMGVDATPTKDSAIANLRKLDSLLMEVESHEGVKLLNSKSCVLLPIQSPPPCQLLIFLSQGHGSVLRHMIGVLIKVLTSSNEDFSEHLEIAQKSLKDITANICGIPPDAFTSSDKSTDESYKMLLETRIDLEAYVLLIIVSHWLILFCGICLQHISPSVKQNKKKKKQKSQQPTADPVPLNGAEPLPKLNSIQVLIDFLTEIKSSLLCATTQFMVIPSEDEKILVEKLNKLYLTAENELEKITDTLKEQQSNIRSKTCIGVIESYNISFRECREIIGLKTSFITSLLQTYSSVGAITNSSSRTLNAQRK